MLSRAKTEELPDMLNLTKLCIANKIKIGTLTNYPAMSKQPEKEGLKMISEGTSKDEEDEERSSFDQKF